MKNILNTLLVFIGLFINLNCNAQQQIYPLKTDYTEIPSNSYLKDLNNELDAYTGNWKASFEGKTIDLFITKETHKHFKTKYEYYKDALSVRYIVSQPSGSLNLILQDTQNMYFQPYEITHTIYSRWVENGNELLLYYGGTNCGIGWGSIKLKKLSATQLAWEYRPNGTVTSSDTCPPGTDKTVYLPVTKELIFTKQ